MVVKSIGVASAAKIYGAISAAFGLVFGMLFALGSMVGAGLSETTEGAFFAPVFGVGAVIILPIFYGVMGLIGGAIAAVLYNVFAGMVGGVSLEVD
jgi:hypothetical protein